MTQKTRPAKGTIVVSTSESRIIGRVGARRRGDDLSIRVHTLGKRGQRFWDCHHEQVRPATEAEAARFLADEAAGVQAAPIYY